MEFIRHFGDHGVKIRHVVKAKKKESNVAQIPSMKYNTEKNIKNSYQVFPVNALICFPLEYK